MNLSVVMITLNEEEYIQRCLDNIKEYVDEIVVIDGGSVDQTQIICKDNGCNVITNIFDGHYGNQRNFGIINSKGRWILSIDADETFEKEFFIALPKLINQKGSVIDAYKFPRKNYINNVYNEKNYPDFQVRLYRRYCRWILPVHEELVGCKHLVESSYHIIHEKISERHHERNSYYDKVITEIYKNDFFVKE